MYHALIWLLVIEVLGLIVLPLAFTLFKRLPDRGLVLSKPLALLLASYILWVLGLTHALPNARYTIILILAALALVSALVLWRNGREILSFLREGWRYLLAAELIFVGIYFLWIAVVSFSPAINHTEKPMDFAFLNAILRSDYFPPEDPWLAGHPISYYYFGHFMMALLTKLTAIPSSITYNLSIALVPALVGAGAFSLVYNLIRLSKAKARIAIPFALAAPLFIVFIGNLEGALEFVQAKGWGSEGFWQWVSIKGLDGTLSPDGGIFPDQSWWWWRASRVIDTVVDGNSLDYTITEFPFFSFLLGDLHPHLTSLPFIILVLSLGLNVFIGRERLGAGWLRSNLWEVFAITLALGALAFLNIWDFPVFAVALAALVIVKGYGDWGGLPLRALLSSLAVLTPILAGAVALYLPFYSTLSSQASGIWALGDVSTRPLHFFLIWGLFMVLGGSFLIRQLLLSPGERDLRAMSLALAITLLPFLLWAGIELLALWTGWGSLINRFGSRTVSGAGDVGARFGLLLPGMVMVGTALYCMLLRVRKDDDGERATGLTLHLLALAMYLIIGAELFYLVDLFGGRMNTVFKLYYQAWVLLAIVSAYGLYYVCSRPVPSIGKSALGKLAAPNLLPLALLRGVLGYGWAALVAALVLVSVYYSVGAALDRTRGSAGNTLDGLAFLGASGGEYEAIRWLRDEAPWGRIVEAVGDDYSEYGRISASTGLPTVLGWKGHEHQWRGSTVLFHGREEQVAEIYGSDDLDKALSLLETYDIRYVYVGPRERDKYGTELLDGAAPFLRPVFQDGDVVIYERLPGISPPKASASPSFRRRPESRGVGGVMAWGMSIHIIIPHDSGGIYGDENCTESQPSFLRKQESIVPQLGEVAKTPTAPPLDSGFLRNDGGYLSS